MKDMPSLVTTAELKPLQNEKVWSTKRFLFFVTNRVSCHNAQLLLPSNHDMPVKFCAYKEEAENI